MFEAPNVNKANKHMLQIAKIMSGIGNLYMGTVGINADFMKPFI